MKIFKEIYKIVSSIPQGKVMTYGQIAKQANTTPNVVGFALHANKNPKEIPCHRVLKQDGTLAYGYAFGGMEKQKQRLEEEGIVFDENKVRGFSEIGCKPPPQMKHQKAPVIFSNADAWKKEISH